MSVSDLVQSDFYPAGSVLDPARPNPDFWPSSLPEWDLRGEGQKGHNGREIQRDIGQGHASQSGAQACQHFQCGGGGYVTTQEV